MRRLKVIFLVLFMQLNLCLNALEPSISIEVLKGPEVIPYLQKLAELRIEFYRNYPYLYEGNITDEETYLNMYAKSKDSLLVIAKNGDEIVGAVTGIPMLESKEENKQLYAQKQIPAEHIFYLGELVLSQDYQKSDLLERLYLQLENAVKGLERYSLLAVCEIERSPEDTKKPVSALSSEVLWANRGFTKQPQLYTTDAWKDVGDLEKSDHHLFFWYKELYANKDPWKGDDYARNSESQKSSADDFLQGMQFQGIGSILDVGCGDGKITAAMARAIPQGSVIGVDISASMIETAKNSFRDSNNLSFIICDAAQIEFAEQFDLITSFTVMQWVLKQSEALQCFERALKPGGKLWIQMPMRLPSEMQQALDKTISSERWGSYFTNFSAPWKFYQKDAYRDLLIDARLSPTRLDVVTKHEKFPSRTIFQGFLKQWFPYLRPIPADQKNAFLTELLDHYVNILPVDEQGRVSFIIDRLEVEAAKSL